MGRRPRPQTQKTGLDTELADLPEELRWREWMGRVEAVIFASPEPVGREVLARLVGRECVLDRLIQDIQAELRARPYELVAVAGGFQHRTRKNFADAIHLATGQGGPKPLPPGEALVLTAIAYYQPITRGELSEFFGREISRDTIGHLRSLGYIGAGPRSPRPGAPSTYVTTKEFLGVFGLNSLRDLPDMEALEEAGLLSKDKLLEGAFPGGLNGDDRSDDVGQGDGLDARE